MKENSTIKFLKDYIVSMPKGWRRMRVGDDFHGFYGFLGKSGHINLDCKYDSHLRYSAAYHNVDNSGGIYLKRKNNNSRNFESSVDF